MRQVRHKTKYRRQLNHLLLQLRLWPIDLKTTRIYGDIYMDLRRRGRILSQVDIMVAALARQMKLPFSPPITISMQCRTFGRQIGPGLN
jgi:predicted nucleic acid-binding protein